MFLADQNRVLELIATGAPLSNALMLLAEVVVAEDSGLWCSIVLFDEDGACIRPGAAPSLPADFMRLLDGLSVDPPVVPCALAVHSRQTVVVPDIAADQRWQPHFREQALRHGLQSCFVYTRCR